MYTILIITIVLILRFNYNVWKRYTNTKKEVDEDWDDVFDRIYGSDMAPLVLGMLILQVVFILVVLIVLVIKYLP